MEDLMPLFVSVGLLLLALITGKLVEARHYQRIHEREDQQLSRPVMTFRSVELDRPVARAELALGTVVVSVDYFKRFMGSFRLLFGGELGSYASVIDRGKREALLRMKEACPGADLFLNCRLETSSISGGQSGRGLGAIEILAVSTAITYRK